MEGIVCKMCGYVSINGNAPEKCPVCGAPQSAFETKDDAIKTPADQANLTDLEKKHIPLIKVMDQGCCSDGCVKLSVTCGEIIHPMQEDHSILHIDLYKNKEFISRVILSAKELNPFAAVCLKEAGGVITAISLCNLHGTWINEESI